MIPARSIALHINERDRDNEALAVHHAAFGSDDEADLTQALMADPTGKPSLSCVAVENDQAVAHVLFTPVTIDAQPDIRGSILCPLAVLPDKQKSGLGTFVVEGGLTNLRLQGVQLVFVLGDPKYYSRFGFEPALPKGLEPPYSLPEKWQDAWMVRECYEGAADGVAGKVRCADTLMDEKYWME